MRRSYLDYAMSVIVGRALPDLRDGLKPVHRRVLYGMNELSNHSNRPHKKSARIAGDVMGKYHPHGDLAIYDTMVRMAQSFSLRYPLIDGQGNFGSVDGDNAAASRYTEVRLSKIAEAMIADLDRETVDFVPNYDGTEREPVVLPAMIPNLLINGSTGIAVGMATNIPPHNLREVVDACLHVLRNPDCTIDELIEIVPAPDFPTGGVIHGIAGVREGYRTGRGRVVMRAKTHFEEKFEKGNNSSPRASIIIDELPYQVNKKTLLERIAELVQEKKLEGISHIQDESDKSGMRVVIDLKRGEVPEVVLNNLFKNTQLQDTFGMNMVALLDGQPRLCNLKIMIDAFVNHRREVVTRRTVFELKKARERGHVLEGLAVALANIDEFIALIKTAPTPPIAKQQLMAPLVGFVAGARDAVARRGRHAGRSRGVPSGRTAAALRHADRRPVPPVGRPGAGDPADAPAAPDRSRAGQDRRRVSRRDGPDRRPARHPGQAGAHHGHHRRRAREDPRRLRRRPAQRDRAERARHERRGPDHAAGHGRDAVPRRLHQEPAGRRVPRAEARRSRQAGCRHEGGRLDRPALHREHARHDPGVLGSRPRVLAEGLRGAAGLARVARQAARQHVAARRRREDHRRAAGQGVRRRALRVHGDVARHRQEDAADRLRQPPHRRHHRGRPRRRGPPDWRRDHRRPPRRDAVLRRRQGRALRRERRALDGSRRARRARHEPRRRTAGHRVAGRGQRGRAAQSRRRRAIGADRDAERLRQAHADRRIHASRPRHEGHDRHLHVGAERQGGGRDARRRQGRDHADHDRRRADPYARRGDPRDGSCDAGRDADQRRRRHAPGRTATRGRDRRTGGDRPPGSRTPPSRRRSRRTRPTPTNPTSPTNPRVRRRPTPDEVPEGPRRSPRSFPTASFPTSQRASCDAGDLR